MLFLPDARARRKTNSSAGLVRDGEKLEHDLNEAVSNEDYEKAAQVRDALRNLKPTE